MQGRVRGRVPLLHAIAGTCASHRGTRTAMLAQDDAKDGEPRSQVSPGARPCKMQEAGRRAHIMRCAACQKRRDAIRGLLVATTLPLAAEAIDMNNAAGLRPDGNADLAGLDLEGMGSSADR